MSATLDISSCVVTSLLLSILNIDFANTDDGRRLLAKSAPRKVKISIVMNNDNESKNAFDMLLVSSSSKKENIIKNVIRNQIRRIVQLRKRKRYSNAVHTCILQYVLHNIGFEELKFLKYLPVEELYYA